MLFLNDVYKSLSYQILKLHYYRMRRIKQYCNIKGKKEDRSEWVNNMCDVIYEQALILYPHGSTISGEVDATIPQDLLELKNGQNLPQVFKKSHPI